jgi:EAL domain-containing protein (putative c-di-GMP-specific phosphodiesterase class I)/DNA-binding response OmpR family regulator
VAEGQTGQAIKPQSNGQSILRLLILEESAPEAQSLIDHLREIGYSVTAARIKSPLEFQAALKKQEWDLIISSHSLPNFSPKQALALLAHAKMEIPLIVISDHIGEDDLTEALRCGACTLIKKGKIDHLQLTVQRELRNVAQRRARHYYEKMFRESERRCQALLESSTNAIACVRNGKVLYSNPSFDRLINNGKVKEPHNIIALAYPDDQQRFEALIKEVETGKNLSDRAELRFLSADDKPLMAIVEAMVAHVNEQQCAQVSISVSVEPRATMKPSPPVEMAPQVSTAPKPSADSRPHVVEVKSRGDNNDPAMTQKIRDALAGNRFRLVYQPIVPLHAQPAENYEVLTRMIDEHGEEVPPGNFMPAAESAGLMTDIDRWIIRAAMQTLVNQHTQNKQTSLLVKLSEDSVGDHSLVPWIAAQLQEFHLPGDTLIFEIKEAYILHRLDNAKQFIGGLKQLHCRTALGNFGSDPQSLDCLEQLHVNFVKLAGAFVDNLAGDPKSQAMVKAVVQTAHDMGTQTIATFVQDASKMSTLWQCNVDYIQGYFLQAPDVELSYNFSDDE